MAQGEPFSESEKRCGDESEKGLYLKMESRTHSKIVLAVESSGLLRFRHSLLLDRHIDT
jgi:hypothetical protein